MIKEVFSDEEFSSVMQMDKSKCGGGSYGSCYACWYYHGGPRASDILM